VREVAISEERAEMRIRREALCHRREKKSLSEMFDVLRAFVTDWCGRLEWRKRSTWSDERVTASMCPGISELMPA
jgi:hypothetical protein